MKNSVRNKIELSGAVWSRRIQKLLAPKGLAVVLTVVYVISLIPLLWIANYNFPSADDYTNGSRCHHVWVAGGSVFGVIGEAFLRTVEEWFTWRGCYTSSFLSALPPNIWGEDLYFLTTWIVLIMLSASTIYLFHAILVKAFKGDKYTAHSIAMLVLLITVQCVYEKGRVEAFYWYSGAINYTFVHGISLFFYGSLISSAFAQGKKKIYHLVLASLLGFLTAGGNQMTMLNAAIVLVMVVGRVTLQKKWKRYRALLIPIGIFFAGFVMAVAAPGNFVRAEAASGMNPVKAILVSLYSCLDLAVDQWTTWPVIVMVAAMVPLFWKLAGRTAFSFRYPLLVVFFGYGVVSAMVTPPLFALGNIEAGRLQAMLFFMYVLVLTLCVGYVTGWVRKRYGKIGEERTDYGKEGSLFLLGCACFLLFGSALTVMPESYYYSATSALTDLLNGSARTYGEEQEIRSQRYLEPTSEAVEVEAFSAQPQLLFFSDVTEDAGDWKNKGVARYYNLEAVKIKKE